MSRGSQSQVIDPLRAKLLRWSHEIEQVLGKALGYPWYKDDQKKFPGATEADGVCVGPNTPESLAEIATERIVTLTKALHELRFAYLNKDGDCPHGFETDALAMCEKLIGPVNTEALKNG